MRLDHFVSQAANITRAQAQRLIRRSAVEVDGVIVRQARQHVDTQASVLLGNDLLILPQPLYLMLHKPIGYVSATEDPSELTVMALIDHPHKHLLHIVGRLDKDTTGLLFLTSDGNWSHQISSPRHKIGKTYRVGLAEPLRTEAIEVLQQGVLLRGEQGLTASSEVQVVDDTEILLTLYEGKYHQVKRMLAAVGNRVVWLHREQVGGVRLDETLPEGQWRALSVQERQALVA